VSAAQRPSGRLLPQPVAAKDDISHLRLFRHLQGIVNLDSEVPYRRLDAAVAEEELDSAQVFRAAVDQSRLRPPHRVRAVAHWIQPNVLDPPVDDSGVLAGADVGRFVQAARKQEIVRLKPCPARIQASTASRAGAVISNWTGRWVLRCKTQARVAT